MRIPWKKMPISNLIWNSYSGKSVFHSLMWKRGKWGKNKTLWEGKQFLSMYLFSALFPCRQKKWLDNLGCFFSYFLFFRCLSQRWIISVQDLFESIAKPRNRIKNYFWECTKEAELNNNFQYLPLCVLRSLNYVLLNQTAPLTRQKDYLFS